MPERFQLCKKGSMRLARYHLCSTVSIRKAEESLEQGALCTPLRLASLLRFAWAALPLAATTFHCPRSAGTACMATNLCTTVLAPLVALKVPPLRFASLAKDTPKSSSL